MWYRIYFNSCDSIILSVEYNKQFSYTFIEIYIFKLTHMIFHFNTFSIALHNSICNPIIKNYIISIFHKMSKIFLPLITNKTA